MSMMSLSRAGVRGIIMGASIMTGFGALWALSSAVGAAGSASTLMLVVVLAVVASLIVAIVHLWQQSGALPSFRSSDEGAYWQKTGKWFGLVFTIEVLAIFVASRLLSLSAHTLLIPSVIALIVGLHFLPLAALFRVGVYYGTGAVMSLLALVCIVALVLGVHLGEASLVAWSSIVGMGSAVILWGTALWIVVQGHQLLRQAGVLSH